MFLTLLALLKMQVLAKTPRVQVQTGKGVITKGIFSLEDSQKSLILSKFQSLEVL